MKISSRQEPKLSLFLAMLSLFSLFFSKGFGQETVLRGIVQDNQGNPLQKVKITLIDPSRGTKFAMNSSKMGEFMKVGIPPSTYKVSFELEGYFRFESQIGIQPGIEEKMSVTLKKIPPKIDDDRDFIEGINFFKEGKYAEAVGLFLRVIEKFPDNIEPFYNLGVSYLRSGNPEKAIGALEKAVHLKPDTVEAYFALGECYFNLGQSEKAMEAFSKATNIEPNSAKAYYNIGIIYYKNNETDKAIGFFEKAMALDPKLSSAYYQAGLANIKKGDFQRAIKHFEDFIRLEPDAPEAGLAKSLIEELKKK